MVHLIGAKKSAPILRMSENSDFLKFQKFFRDPKFSWDVKKFSWKSRIFGTSKIFDIFFKRWTENPVQLDWILAKWWKIQSSKVDFLEFSVQQPKKSKIQSSKMKFFEKFSWEVQKSDERSKNRFWDQKSVWEAKKWQSFGHCLYPSFSYFWKNGKNSQKTQQVYIFIALSDFLNQLIYWIYTCKTRFLVFKGPPPL